MKIFLYATALLAASLGGCRHEAAAPGADPQEAGTVVGNWRLTQLQCYCPANQPVPDETITFDASQHFRLFRKGVLAAEGTYAIGQAPHCGGSSAEPSITLSASAPGTYVPSGAYSLQGGTLVIDQCLAADGPRYTYQRQ